MKKLLLLFMYLLIIAVVSAQVPQAFSYKVQIKGNGGNPHSNKKVNLKISILQDNIDGSAVYIERHSVNTSSNGVVDIEVGRGTPISGLFSEIDWANWPYFIKVELDLKCGGDYNLLAVTELLTVPYAMYAGKSANGFSGDYNDLQNKPQIPENLSELTNDVGYISQETDGDNNNEIQELSVSKYGDTLRLSKSNWVLVPGISNANNCFPNLPDPIFVFKGTEKWTNIDGIIVTRYLFDVSNKTAFPDALFEPSPELPPCGINASASRSFVHIYDKNHNKIYSFCGITSNFGLAFLNFSTIDSPPDSVYIVIEDRRCRTNYVSNLVYITSKKKKPPLQLPHQAVVGVKEEQ